MIFGHPDKARKVQIYMNHLLAAVKHMHEKNVLYRDVKPSNVLWNDTTERAILIDFDVATFFSKDRLHRRFVGTDGFIGPEVEALEKARKNGIKPTSKGYDMAVDVWGAGMVFGQLLFEFSESDVYDADFQSKASGPAFVKRALKSVCNSVLSCFDFCARCVLGCEGKSSIRSLSQDARARSHQANYHRWCNRTSLFYKNNIKRFNRKIHNKPIATEKKNAKRKMKKRVRESKQGVADCPKKVCRPLRLDDLTDPERQVLAVLAIDSRSLDLSNIESWDRQACSRVFECVCALEYGLLLWAQIPQEALRKHGVKRYGDKGIDAASADLAVSLQAKFYAPGASVSWRCVSTFFTYAVGVLPSSKLILATSENVKLAKEVKLIKRPLALELHTLTNETILHQIRRAKEFAVAMTQAPTLPLSMPILQLRPHQEAAMAKIVPWLSEPNAKYFRYCSACGTGKTVVYSRICEWVRQEKKGVTAILVPSINLLLQMRQEILKWLPTMRIGLVGGKHEAILPVDVIVCIYNSVHKIQDQTFDTVIVDEGHHVDELEIEEDSSGDEEEDEIVGESKNKEADESGEEEETEEGVAEEEDEDCEWEEKREEEEKEDEKKDGAEEKNDEKEYKSVNGDEDEDEKEEDDDIESRAGVYAKKIFALKTRKFLLGSATLAQPWDFCYSMAQAIFDGIICDYTLCIPVFEAGPGTHDLGLVKLIHQHHEWQGILAYLNSRAEAKQFQQLLNDNGIEAAYLDGKMSHPVRAAILEEFRTGNWRVLVTVNVLNEGVDLPECNTAMFVRPRHSRINVIQILGRILRRCPALAKSLAYVVLPCVDEIQQITRFLRLIGDVDGRIKRSFVDKTFERVEFLYPPEAISEQDTPDRALVRERLLTKVGLDLAKSHFDYVYNIIRAEIDKGAVLPPRSHSQKPIVWQGIRIEPWVQVQIVRKRKNLLSDEQIKLLEELPGFAWPVSYKDRMKAKILAYTEYVELKGQAPKRHTIWKGCCIGNWMTKNRRNKDKMSPEQRAVFESLPLWSWDLQWHQKLDLYVAYFTEHGKFALRKTKLGRWLYKCCIRVKHRLSEAQKSELDSRLPNWDKNTQKAKWKKHYEDLKQFSETHDVEPTRNTNQVLYQWLISQRRWPERLSNEQKNLLSALYPNWQRLAM